jgi:hypothetical protein
METLAEFAASDTKEESCCICELAEAQEINQGFRNGIPLEVIRRYLFRKKGLSNAAVARLARHFERGHHEPR